jgi:nucleoside phosphorylase
MIITLPHQHFKPQLILMCGTAGAIDPKLKLRDVVIAEYAFSVTS